MTYKIALQMDAIHLLNPRTDSTLVLGMEAQKRGYELYYYTPDTLTWREGRVTASGHPVKLLRDAAEHYQLEDKITLDLQEMDVILLRQDPPFDIPYITTTYLLEQLPPKTLVINDPASVRNHPEKLFPFAFRAYMPPTLVTADLKEIEHFRSQYRDIIIKPLYGHGGRSVLRLKPEDDNLSALIEMHASTSREPLMIQPYLPEVKTSDRRIILIDGKIGGIMGRIPAENEVRANFRVGGSPAKAELTPRQREICEALEAPLRDKGILFAGIDVIGDYLTEINITSPTGLVQMNALYGVTLEADIWNAIENRISRHMQ